MKFEEGGLTTRTRILLLIWVGENNDFHKHVDVGHIFFVFYIRRTLASKDLVQDHVIRGYIWCIVDVGEASPSSMLVKACPWKTMLKTPNHI